VEKSIHEPLLGFGLGVIVGNEVSVGEGLGGGVWVDVEVGVLVVVGLGFSVAVGIKVGSGTTSMPNSIVWVFIPIS
jgi:hypothetical protein